MRPSYTLSLKKAESALILKLATGELRPDNSRGVKWDERARSRNARNLFSPLRISGVQIIELIPPFPQLFYRPQRIYFLLFSEGNRDFSAPAWKMKIRSKLNGHIFWRWVSLPIKENKNKLGDCLGLKKLSEPRIWKECLRASWHRVQKKSHLWLHPSTFLPFLINFWLCVDFEKIREEW